MERPKIIKIAALMALLLMSLPLFADGKSSQFGIVYGLSVPDADNTGNFRVSGVKGAAYFNPAFSAGGYYLQSDSSGQPSASEPFQYSLTGVESAYHIPGATGDTFVALRVGLTKLKTAQNGTDVTFSPYHYGLATGYDFYFNNYISFGFEGSYLHVEPNRTINNGTTYLNDSFNILNFLITLQLRL